MLEQAVYVNLYLNCDFMKFKFRPSIFQENLQSEQNMLIFEDLVPKKNLKYNINNSTVITC